MPDGGSAVHKPHASPRLVEAGHGETGADRDGPRIAQRMIGGDGGGQAVEIQRRMADPTLPGVRGVSGIDDVELVQRRGMGLSSHPAGGFDKMNQGRDLQGLLKALKVTRFDLVTHDIGNMVGFALATQQPERIGRFVVIDAPVPGVGPWDDNLKNPLLWHFRFGGPHMERLVAGRERIYLDRFWNEFSATPARFDEASRQHYAALYARPGAMRAGFAQFAAFDQDAADNRAWLAAGGKLTMPVLALGGEKSFGPMMAVTMRAAATDVTAGVVPGSGHWIMEENPTATVALAEAFLEKAD